MLGTCQKRESNYLSMSKTSTSLPLIKEDDGVDAVMVPNFRDSLVKFEHTEPSLRRSPRKHNTGSTTIDPKQAISVRSPGKKRSPSAFDSYDQDPVSQRSPKRGRKGYAPPDTYAHLHVLQDYLAEELDGKC
jgi:hypothetical protein